MAIACVLIILLCVYSHFDGKELLIWSPTRVLDSITKLRIEKYGGKILTCKVSLKNSIPTFLGRHVILESNSVCSRSETGWPGIKVNEIQVRFFNSNRVKFTQIYFEQNFQYDDLKLSANNWTHHALLSQRYNSTVLKLSW